MTEEIVRHFPVVNEKGTIVGIVSDRDLFTPDARIASDVMTRTVVTVSSVRVSTRNGPLST